MTSENESDSLTNMTECKILSDSGYIECQEKDDLSELLLTTNADRHVDDGEKRCTEYYGEGDTVNLTCDMQRGDIVTSSSVTETGNKHCE